MLLVLHSKLIAASGLALYCLFACTCVAQCPPVFCHGIYTVQTHGDNVQILAICVSLADSCLVVFSVGMAGEELATAAGYCWTCSQHNGNLQAIWKLMGDVYLQFHATTPPHQVWH